MSGAGFRPQAVKGPELVLVIPTVEAPFSAADYYTTVADISATSAPAVFPITQYGASPGLADNSQAIANTLEAITAAGGGIMIVPTGQVFPFASSQGLPSVPILITGGGTLRGTTPNMAMFIFNGGNNFTDADITFDKVNLDGGASGVIGIYLLSAAGSNIRNCLFTGIAYSAILDHCYDCEITSNRARGNANYPQGQLCIRTTSGATYGYSSDIRVRSYHNDVTTKFGLGGSQVSPLILVSDTEFSEVTDCFADIFPYSSTIDHIEFAGTCQGCYFNDDAMLGANRGLYVTATGSGTPAFNYITNYGADSFTVGGIVLSGASPGSLNLITITGGSATGALQSSAAGIVATNIGLGLVINSVQFFEWQNYPTISSTGIKLTSCNNVIITACNFGQSTNGVDCITACGYKCSNVTIDNNSFVTTTNPVTGDLSGGVKVGRGNLLPATPTPLLPTAPASGTAYINTTGYELAIAVTPGTATISSISYGSGVGLTAPLTAGGVFNLPPGGNAFLEVTYTGGTIGWNVSVLA